MIVKYCDKGKQICSMADFEKSECKYFFLRSVIGFNFVSRWLITSWQYQTVKDYIDSGCVFEAEEEGD